MYKPKEKYSGKLNTVNTMNKIVYILKENKKAIIVIVLIVQWFFQLASRFLWTGHYYGKTNIIYHTLDSICYVKNSYVYANLNQNFILDMTNALVAQGNNISQSEVFQISNSSSCQGVNARILLPFLASFLVPYVKVNAIWLIPTLSWLILILVCAISLLRRGYFLGALIGGSLAINSSSLTLWSVSAMTDVLLMMIVAVATLSSGILSIKNNKLNYVVVIVCIVLGSLTRQSWPYFISLGVVHLLNFLKMKQTKDFIFGSIYISVSLISFIMLNKLKGKQNGPQIYRDIQSLKGQAPQVNSDVGNSGYKPIIDTISLLDRFFDTLITGSIKTLAVEIQGLFLRDISIVLLTILSVYALFIHKNKIYLFYVPALYICGLTITALNYSISNFRFFLPVLGPLIISSALTIRSTKTSYR